VHGLSFAMQGTTQLDVVWVVRSQVRPGCSARTVTFLTKVGLEFSMDEGVAKSWLGAW